MSHSSHYFPGPNSPTIEGVIAVGGDFSVEIVDEAYSKGIFPWPSGRDPLMWFSPDPRGVLDFGDLHIPESLKKFRRRNKQLTLTCNAAFEDVMRACRDQKRPNQDGTWILDEMIPVYSKLQKLGRALSMEVWQEHSGGRVLVGGIYGVLSKKYFSGESMFFRTPNASKLALWALIEELQRRGHTWMDVQMVTPILESFGAKYISREDFLLRLV